MRNEAYGGANQFLKALKKYFVHCGVEADSLEEADVILFNSSNLYSDVLKLKKKYPNKIFVHRVDGPCKLYNNMSDTRDDMVYQLNDIVADATIFQSNYSRESSIAMGCPCKKYETTITNACDSSIFYPKNAEHSFEERKVKLIATSFSDNLKKGFKTYQWLDNNLDFGKYEMTFVGRSPYEFKNIKYVSPRPSNELAQMLRSSDIYITASENDPCSNSVIEALACGLPVLALNSGGHPELVQDRGELFDNPEDIPKLIDKIVNNYVEYTNAKKHPDMTQVGQAYVDFMEYLYEEKEAGNLIPNRMSNIDVWKCILEKKLKKWG
jgi:glycosyltransferase involved in cell wall biosynthesis